MSKIYIKDKTDFERFNNRKENNVLNERIFFRDSTREEDKGKNKVEIMIAVPSCCKEVREELAKIKD